MKKRNRHYSDCGMGRYKKKGGRMRSRLRTLTSSQGFYRSRNGIFMGVCKGLAEHFNFSVFWLRAVMILVFLFTGFWPVGVMYIVAGLVLSVEPVSPLRDEKDQAFYNDFTRSRESALQRIRRKYESMERRIQRMEHTVTSREFDWK